MNTYLVRKPDVPGRLFSARVVFFAEFVEEYNPVDRLTGYRGERHRLHEHWMVGTHGNISEKSSSMEKISWIFASLIPSLWRMKLKKDYRVSRKRAKRVR